MQRRSWRGWGQNSNQYTVYSVRAMLDISEYKHLPYAYGNLSATDVMQPAQPLKVVLVALIVPISSTRCTRASQNGNHTRFSLVMHSHSQLPHFKFVPALLLGMSLYLRWCKAGFFPIPLNHNSWE